MFSFIFLTGVYEGPLCESPIQMWFLVLFGWLNQTMDCTDTRHHFFMRAIPQ